MPQDPKMTDASMTTNAHMFCNRFQYHAFFIWFNMVYAGTTHALKTDEAPSNLSDNFLLLLVDHHVLALHYFYLF